MKTLYQTNCEIFDIVNENELILYSDLPKIDGANRELVLQSISKLSKDHGLISVKNQKLSLSEKGLKHESFESYLKSLKKEPIPRYQKIYLPLFIIFGFSAMILGILNHLSNKEVDFQKEKYNLLESDFVRYKDSVNEQNTKTVKSTSELLNDTSQTNNYPDADN